MSASLRIFRATLYDYNDAGVDGAMDSSYGQVASPDADGLYWCSRAPATDTEQTLVAKADHQIDAVIGFAASVPVDDDSLIVVEGVQYLVRAILVRDYFRDEVQVLCERTSDTFTFTTPYDPNAPPAEIALSASSFTFSAVQGEASPGAALLTITNSGGGVLAGPTVEVAGGAWLAVVVAGVGANSYRATLTPTTNALTPGPYTITLTVRDVNATNEETATATLDVAPSNLPVLAISSTATTIAWATGDPAPATTALQLSNSGGGILAGPTIQSQTFGGVEVAWATATIAGFVLSVAYDMSGITLDGDSTLIVVVADPNSATTVTHTIYLTTDALEPVPPVVMSVGPSPLFATALVGTSPAAKTLTVSEALGAALATLGTVTAIEVVDQPWLSLAYLAGTVTVTFATGALTANTYNATVRVTSTTALNSPVDVPLSLTMYDLSPAAAPVPRTAQSPAGVTWNRTTGMPAGSVFNAGGYSGAANYAKPTFGGAIFPVTTQALLNALPGLLSSGGIVDGDSIVIQSGLVVNSNTLIWPARPGWVEGTSGFVQVTTSDLSTLEGMIPHSGTVFTRDRRFRPVDHAAYSATIKTTATNRSVIVPARGAGGYWFDGLTILADTPQYTNCVVDLSASGGMGQVSHLPSHIVFNRCWLTSTNGHRSTFIGHARYSGCMHSTLDPAYQNNDENKSLLAWNTTGPLFMLGNSMSAWGMSMLLGGAAPSIAGVTPSDVDFRHNYCWNNVANAAVSNDCKNFVEGKTGRRVLVAFNVVSVLAYKGDQQYAVLIKTGSQSGGAFLTESRDWCIWANDFRDRCGKGFLGLADIWADGGIGGALGTSNIEVAYNCHLYTVLSGGGTDVAGPTGLRGISLARSLSNGIAGLDIYHNTYEGLHSDLECADSTSPAGAGWSVVFEDNINVRNPYYGPYWMSGAANTSEGFFPRAFGASGAYRHRYNGHLTGARSAFTAAIQATPYFSKAIALTGAGFTQPFVDRPSGNVRFVTAHPMKASASDGKDWGADLDYLDRVTSGVTAN